MSSSKLAATKLSVAAAFFAGALFVSPVFAEDDGDAEKFESNAMPVAGPITDSEDRPFSKRSKRLLAKYEKTGKRERCLRLRTFDESRPVDDYRIVFEGIGSKIYVNEIPRRCSGLGFERRFSFTTSLSELCKDEIITVFDSSGFRRGSCGLGWFHEVVEVEQNPDEVGAAQETQSEDVADASN